MERDSSLNGQISLSITFKDMDVNETPPKGLRPIRFSGFKDDATGEIWINKGQDGYNRIVSMKELNAAIAAIELPDAEPTTPATPLGTLIYKADVTIDFPSIAAGASNTQNLTIANVLPGDIVFVGRPTGLDAQTFIYGFCNGAGTVSVRTHNYKASTAVDPPSAVYPITVIRF